MSGLSTCRMPEFFKVQSWKGILEVILKHLISVKFSPGGVSLYDFLFVRVQ